MDKMNKTLVCIALGSSFFAQSVSADGIAPYIVGGDDAVITDFKSFAQIRMQEYEYDPSFHYSSCGASIVNNQFILTAAHCVTDKVVYDMEVTDPDYDPSGEDWENRYSIHEDKNIDHIKVVVKNTSAHDVHVSELKAVDSVFVPSEYYARNVFSDSFDIAIIKLKYPIKPSDNVSQIVLPSDGDDSFYDVDLPLLELVGLGVNNQNFVDGSVVSQEVPEFLLYTKVQLLSDNYSYSSTELDADGWPKHAFWCSSADVNKLCVTHPGFVEDQPLEDVDLGAACRGDSGGPLYWTKDGVRKQIGIVSSGAQDCSSIAGSYYTEVEHYLPWINGVIATESTPDTSDLSGYDPLLDDGNVHSDGDHGFVADTIVDDGCGVGDCVEVDAGSGGSGGGSINLLALLGLGFLGLRRKVLGVHDLHQ